MIVIFDRQHYGKPNQNDLGAGVDLDGDGTVETAEREANLTPLYYLPAKAALEALGHTVYVLDSGWYSERHQRADDIARNNPHELVAYLVSEKEALLSASSDSSAAVMDQMRPALRVQLPAKASSWTPSGAQCLVSGESYAWAVRALTARQEAKHAEVVYPMSDKWRTGQLGGWVNATRRGNKMYVWTKLWPHGPAGLGGVMTPLKSACLLPDRTPLAFEQKDQQ